MIHLVTGKAGKSHITSLDQSAYNAGIVGKGKYVLKTGSMFAYQIVSNNLIKIRDGDLINQGRHINIPLNSYEECRIDTGDQGLKRNDLIVIRYSKNVETQLEKAEIITIKGKAAASPTDPTYTTGDILSGDLVDDFPLYRIRLNATNIDAIEPLFKNITSVTELREMFSKKINGVAYENGNIDIPIKIQELQNEDLNSLMPWGYTNLYFGKGGNTVKNKPNTTVDNFALMVTRSGGDYYMQLLFANVPYIRQGNSNRWTAWTEIYTPDNIPDYVKKTGDRLSGSLIFDNGSSILINSDSGTFSTKYGNSFLTFMHYLSNYYDMEVGDKGTNTIYLHYDKAGNGTINFYDRANKDSKYVFGTVVFMAQPILQNTTTFASNVYVDDKGILYKVANSTERIKENFEVVQNLKQNIDEVSTYASERNRTFNIYQDTFDYVKDVLKINVYFYDYQKGIVTQEFDNGEPSKQIIGYKAEEVAQYAQYAAIYDTVYNDTNTEKPEFTQLSPEEIKELSAEEKEKYQAEIKEYKEKLKEYEERQSGMPVGTIDYSRPKDWDPRKMIPALHVCVQDHDNRLYSAEYIISEQQQEIEHLKNELTEIKKYLGITDGKEEASN